MRLRSCATVVALLLLATLAPAARAQDAPACPDLSALTIPGAEFSQAVCLEDLTTLSNPRTDTGAATGAGTRGSGSIHSKLTRFPQEPVPGVQIEGWFPDSCDHYAVENNSFMPRCSNGLRRNGQFVIRVPNGWDGQHLVVAGTPGVRTQFSSDIIISDFVLARGWAYASQDKGNTGLNFFRAGDEETGGSRTQWIPAKATAQWAERMRLAALAAQGALSQLHGREADLTYATGISNGGHQTRLALEQFPDLFDGGVDWEGTLLIPEAPNLFTYLPPALNAYPAYKLGSDDAYEQIVHEGRMPPDSEPIWDNHWSIYWGLVQSTYRPLFDPEYTNYVAAPREVVFPDPDASYDFESRPDVVRERLASVANTGQINGKPLLTLHGTLDALLPIDTDSDVYAEMVRAQGNGENFRYYVVENGTHVDKLQESFPNLFQPIQPCYLDALDALDAWVVHGSAPPPSGFVPFDADTTAEQRANECTLPAIEERVTGSDAATTAIAASRGAYGISDAVVLASASSFADGLAAGPLAAKLGGPLLLVEDAVTPELRRELERLGARRIVAVGGPAAISDELLQDLAIGSDPFAVQRVSGPDRYATAAAVAEELGADAGEAFVTSGEAFPDALSVAPLAAASQTPILLSRGDELPDPTRRALRDLAIEDTVVIGGRAAVADAVLRALPSPVRVAGPSRYETSVAVAELALERGHTLEQVLAVTGRDFTAALVAGPVATVGYGGAPGRGVVLLTDDNAPAARAFLREHAGEVDGVVLLGDAILPSAAAR
jgi:putative cell wall-binding protein